MIIDLNQEVTMSIIARNPIDFRWMDDLFGDVQHKSTFTPAFDVQEREAEVIINADLPGVAEEDIEIQVKNDRITIAGSRKIETKGRSHVERLHGSFARTFSIPKTATDQISASLKDGVLTIKIPKRPEQVAKKIQISRS